MQIQRINDLRKITNLIPGKILGVGVTAFMRILPALLFKRKFQILCYKNSLDNNIFACKNKLFCVQSDYPDAYLAKKNANSLIQIKPFQKHLQTGKIKYLFVYKSSKIIEEICHKYNIVLLTNNSNIRDKYEDKKYFRELLSQIHLNPITGENINLSDFLNTKYSDWVKKLGTEIVIQLPDIKIGGGKGTIFLHNQIEFDYFQQQISTGIYKKKNINTLNITKYITGISTSIIGCITKFGVLSSSVQTQIIDIPEVINIRKGNGLFCGHDWSLQHYSDKIQSQAENYVNTIGNAMTQEGYLGIFGLDLIVNLTEEKVYVVECNSRYTGAFPMLSMLDLQNNIIPMDLFHILEFAKINYQINFNKINQSYKYPRQGSHIIISNQQAESITCKQDILPGVYTFKNNQLNFLRTGFTYNQIKNNNEFIIIDGNPHHNEQISNCLELSRICHLLFPIQITNTYNQLNDYTRAIISTIYKKFF